MYKSINYNHNNIGDDMTEKELAYFEDAVGHEGNIVKILDNSISMIEDSSIKEFMESELNKHKDRKEKLVSFLEGNSNEWSINYG